VEDEPDVRRILKKLFVSEGFVVTEASHGAEGLVRLRGFRPDVVILDLMMPVMDGWTFAEECHRMAEYRDLPIIATSASFDRPRGAPALDALGLRKCLAKPFDLDELLSLVTGVVDGQGDGQLDGHADVERS
jgi:CheY-like chemotaxis protein